MKLYNLIAIWITFIFATLLVTVLVVTFNIIKDSAKKELYENAQNSATSLSLTIGHTEVNQGNIETTINASFDNGNYERIAFVDPEGKVLYERIKNMGFSDIPNWFKTVVAFDLDTARIDVSNGWQVAGSIKVLGDRSIAYLQLYKIMTNILTYLGVACVIILLILAYIFGIVLKPLKEIEKQAQAVMNDDFVIQKKEPWVREFKSVVKSINSMVEKFENIFQNASITLSENKKLLYSDPVMKISNKRYFILKMTEYLADENGNNHGAIIIISMKKVYELNQILGYKKTDKLLFDFAQFINKEICMCDDSIVSRTNGTELIILLPRIKIEKIESLMQNILNYVDKQLDEYKLDKEEFGIFAGVCEYEAQHNMNEIFDLLDCALEQAKLFPSKAYYKLINDKASITNNEWKHIIVNGLENDNFVIIHRDVLNTKTKEKHHFAASFALKNEKNELYFYGTLIPHVMQLGLIQDVYMHIVEKILLSDNKSKNTIPLSIQISAQFVEDQTAHERLRALFVQSKNKIRRKIIFELPESLINSQFENSVRLVKLFKEFGFDFGINSFMAYSEDYNYLKKLKPLFVKADKNYILDKQQNISIAKIVLDSIGAKFIATGVEEIEEIEKLNKKGIFAISGAVVDKLQQQH